MTKMAQAFAGSIRPLPAPRIGISCGRQPGTSHLMVDYKLRAIAALLAILCVSGTSHAGYKAPWQMPPNDFGGAEPVNPRDWITFEDYPSDAISNREQGYVVVSFDITAKGRVENCQVTRSSGHKSLDAVPCPKLQRIARFKPATNANGEPIATKGSASAPFWMP